VIVISMKIQFCSDLHLEMRDSHYYRPDQTTADVLVFAGDIHSGLGVVEFVKQEGAKQNRPVILVVGNHEFYGHDYHHRLNKIRTEASQCKNVHLLENSEVVIDGTRFLGATLWADYLGSDPKDEAINMAYAGRMLRDHTAIRMGEYNFTPRDAQELCRVSKLFLAFKLNAKFDGPTVVVTHHGPSLKCQHLNYRASEISAAFQSDFDYLVEKADVWIYGHSHSNLDTMVGKCRLVSNQQGYPSEELPVPYRPDWIVEV